MYNCKMRLRLCLVEYQQSSIESVRLDWLAYTLDFQDRILLNYTRIENPHKVRKTTFNVLLCFEVQQIFRFPLSLLRRYLMDAAMLKTVFSSSCNSSIMLQKLVM